MADVPPPPGPYGDVPPSGPQPVGPSGGPPPGYGAPAGPPPGYGAPAGPPPGYGAPAGPPPGYGAPADYGAAGYPQGFGGPPYVQAKTNTNAIVSLVTSILAWVACPVVLAIVGLVTGTMARRQIRESNGMETGDGLAIGGIIISIANIALLGIVVVLILLVTLLGHNASSKFSAVASAIR